MWVEFEACRTPLMQSHFSDFFPHLFLSLSVFIRCISIDVGTPNDARKIQKNCLILKMDSRQFGGISVELFIHSTSFAKVQKKATMKNDQLNRNNKQRKCIYE